MYAKKICYAKSVTLSRSDSHRSNIFRAKPSSSKQNGIPNSQEISVSLFWQRHPIKLHLGGGMEETQQSAGQAGLHYVDCWGSVKSDLPRAFS